MNKFITKTNLQNDLILLRPIVLEDEQKLNQAISDGALDKLWFTHIPNPKDTKSYITKALKQMQNKKALCFVVWHKKDEKIIGSSRFFRLDSKNKKLEIGYTWYAKSYQKTGINTSCKYLMLSFAFEKLYANKVEFRTHEFNYKSREAITKLGAIFDGVLRCDEMLKDGSFRNTYVFSILKNEWISVKKNLQLKLERNVCF